MPSQLVIREASLDDAPEFLAELHARWGPTVVSRGIVHDIAGLPALLAELDGRPAGCLAFAACDNALEVVTLDAFVPRQGVGAALMDAAAQMAERIWLVTTNDNATAQRFYAALGMLLVAIHPGAVNAARLLKPGIPPLGYGGVPIEDEYEYEWWPRESREAAVAARPGALKGCVAQVRRIAPDEWRRYRQLRLRALGDAPDAFASTLEHALGLRDDDWQRRLQAAGSLDLPLFAELGGIPIGLTWGHIESHAPTTCHLFQMWVDPRFRGRGAAPMLVDAVVEWARRNGAHEVLLDVTRGNLAAFRLYRSAGFAVTGSEGPVRPGSPLVEQQMRLELAGPGA